VCRCAFHVIDAAVDVVAGLEDEIAATQFHELRGVGRGDRGLRGVGVARHAGIGRHEASTFLMSCPAIMVTLPAAESADALEEITEVHPPGSGGAVFEFALIEGGVGGTEFPGLGIDITAAVEPVHRQLALGIIHERAGDRRLMDDIACALIVTLPPARLNWAG